MRPWRRPDHSPAPLTTDATLRRLPDWARVKPPCRTFTLERLASRAASGAVGAVGPRAAVR